MFEMFSEEWERQESLGWRILQAEEQLLNGEYWATSASPEEAETKQEEILAYLAGLRAELEELEASAE